jgi:hypothetical protein
MYESMIGRWTKNKEELGNIRKLITWAELYYLKEGKRSITWENLEYNPHLKIWIYSSNSDVYFLLEEVVDNIGLRRWIAKGDAYLEFNQEHEDKVRAGMAVIGKQYDFGEIKYEEQYLPLVELLIHLEVVENQSNKDRSVAEVQAIKRDIKQLKDR